MADTPTTWYRPLRGRAQEVSRRNARVAMAQLLTRRQEREDAAHYVELMEPETTAPRRAV